MTKTNAQKQLNKHAYGKKHPLIIYRLLGRRYRPAGVLLFVVGLMAQIPRFFPGLLQTGSFITTEQLSLVGIFALLIGLLLIVTSVWEERRAFVQCQPDYLLIHTASSRVAVSYQRFNSVKSVKIGDIYRWREYKGRDQQLTKPLAGDTAVELVVKDFPLPDRVLRVRLSKFLISTRDKGFIFIVPRPTELSVDLNTYRDRFYEALKEAEGSRYTDPIDRMRRQESRTIR